MLFKYRRNWVTKCMQATHSYVTSLTLMLLLLDDIRNDKMNGNTSLEEDFEVEIVSLVK